MKKEAKSVLGYYKAKGYQELITDQSILLNYYLEGILSEESIVDMSIMEIGAGASQYRDLFLKMHCKKYTGIELVRERIPTDIPDRCEYHCTDIHEFDASEKYDIIFFSLTYVLIGDRKEVLDKCYKLLTSGGALIFIEPNYLSVITFFRTVYAKMFKKAPIIPFNPYGLKSKLLELGMSVEHHSFFTSNKKLLKNPLIATNTKILARKR